MCLLTEAGPCGQRAEKSWAESLGCFFSAEFVVVLTEPGSLQHARHSIRALDPQLPYLQR